jgi:hypothetical protein
VSWPKNDLEKLLVAAAENADHRPDFIKALRSSELCAITDKEGSTQAGGGAKVMGLKAPDGLPAVPMFTSPERVAETFGAGTPFFCARGEVLLDVARKSRVVFDPGQPFGFIFSPEDLDHILGVERVIDSPMNAQFSMPKEIPQQLVEHLKVAFAAESGIKGAWLALAYWPDTKETAWYLDVRTKLDRAQVKALLRDVATNSDMLGKPMDVVVKDPSESPGIGLQVGNQ